LRAVEEIDKAVCGPVESGKHKKEKQAE